MSETIRARSRGGAVRLHPVRLVLGGLGARLEFSFEQLDDLYLAAEELFRAALEAEDATRFGRSRCASTTAPCGSTAGPLQLADAARAG